MGEKKQGGILTVADVQNMYHNGEISGKVSVLTASRGKCVGRF